MAAAAAEEAMEASTNAPTTLSLILTSPPSKHTPTRTKTNTRTHALSLSLSLSLSLCLSLSLSFSLRERKKNNTHKQKISLSLKKTRILRSTKPWYVMRMEGIFFFPSATNLRLQLCAIEEVLGVKCMKANVDCCWQIKNGRKTRSSREERALPPPPATAAAVAGEMLAGWLTSFLLQP
jgi:hypothetical protein